MPISKLREAFFDKAQETLVIFDEDLNFIDVNDAFAKSLHVQKEDIIGKNIAEISPGFKDTERYRVYKEVIATGVSVILDEARLHPSLGNYVARISIFKLGEGLGLTATNVSDLKESVSELETFIYKSSHDMRAPLASILGLINVANEEMRDLDSARRYLNTIRGQAERLDLILRRLVETAGIRTHEKTIHLIDFRGIINEVIESLSYTEGFKHINIESHISEKRNFYSDKSIIISLFQNLIDNAIKYQNESIDRSFLKINIEDEENGVIITFADNGIGIMENLQEDIFNMFFRATNKAAGSGLGLYTVKHGVRNLGGRIRVESTEGQETIFTLNLPSGQIKVGAN